MLSFIVVQLLLIRIPCTIGFSTRQPSHGSKMGGDVDKTIQQRTFIELTKPNNGSARTSDRLPASFVSDWPTWVLEDDGTVSRIPDQTSHDGFVSPTSIDELWLPIDLKRPNMKLALGLHIRSGTIRHVMPALDLSYDGRYRNRGMNSVPRAHTWMEFSTLGLIDEWERFNLKVLSRKRGDDDDEWEQLALSSSGKVISDAVKKAQMFLAESAPDEFGIGSHILHVVIDEDNVLEPPTSSDIRVTLSDDQSESHDSETDGDGILDVAVSTTMSGSDSIYLPDVYKPLYNDESLKNPFYAKFKERKEERN